MIKRMMGIDSGFTIDDLLFSDDARRAYEHLCPYFTESELRKNIGIIADYCNERAMSMRIQKQLASADLIVKYTNSHSKTNDDKNKLSQLLNESSKRILALQKELKITPKASGGTSEIDASELDVD